MNHFLKSDLWLWSHVGVYHKCLDVSSAISHLFSEGLTSDLFLERHVFHSLRFFPLNTCPCVPQVLTVDLHV